MPEEFFNRQNDVMDAGHLNTDYTYDTTQKLWLRYFYLASSITSEF